MSVLSKLGTIRDQCAHIVELRSRQVNRMSGLTQKHAASVEEAENAQVALHEAMIALCNAEIALIQAGGEVAEEAP